MIERAEKRRHCVPSLQGFGTGYATLSFSCFQYEALMAMPTDMMITIRANITMNVMKPTLIMPQIALNISRTITAAMPNTSATANIVHLLP